MNAWDRIAGNKPYPMAPDAPDTSGEGDFRFPAAAACWVVGAIAFPVAFVAALDGA